MKSKQQRDKKARQIERQIREIGTPTNPKAASYQWSLVVELSKVLEKPLKEVKSILWPKQKKE